MFAVARKEDDGDRETAVCVCVCVGGGIKSNVSPFSFTICFSGDGALLSDSKALRG